MKRVFLVGVVTTCLAACGAKGFGDPPSTEPAAMRALVAQLIAASGTTNAAPIRDAVLKAGPAALPALREALARTGGIPFDTARILRALAMELGGLKSGAVVRGHATDPTSSGITDGDVVVREGPHEVQSRADMGLSDYLDRFGFDHGPEPLSDRLESWNLVLRKPDGCDTNVIVKSDKAFPLRFADFPDNVHKYLVQGSLGPWDTLVAEALWKETVGECGRTAEVMAEAFTRGCRDPLAFTTWIEALNESGGFGATPFICESYERQLCRSAESESLRLGRIAVAKSRSHLLAGQMDMALKIADQSAVAARANGLTNVLGLLTPWRVTLGMISDPVSHLAYARTNADEVRKYVNPRGKDGAIVVRRAVHRYMAIGRPDMARMFLDLFDARAAWEVRKEFESQVRLAVSYSNDLAQTRWVPMKAAIESHAMSARSGHFQIYNVRNVKVRGSFRLDWTMWLSKVNPMVSRRWASEISARVPGQEGMIAVGLDNRGRLRVGAGYVENLMSGTIGSPTKRHEFSLRVMPHAVQVDVDGQPHFIRYFENDVDPMFAVTDQLAEEFPGFAAVLDDTDKRAELMFHAAGCESVVEGIVAYAPTMAKMDTDAMAKTFRAMELAIAQANVPVATQAWESLRIAYRPLGENNPLLKDMEKRMEILFAGVDRKWTSLRDMSEKSKVYSGLWRRDGEWFTVSATNSESAGASVAWKVKLDNVELVGIVDIPQQASNASCFIHWNSTWTKGDSAFHITPGAGTLEFGVWQDSRLFKKVQFEKTGGLVPFCIRMRGPNAVVFVGKGDKPAAFASELGNKHEYVNINFRNMGMVPCRIGELRARSYPLTCALDAPAEMPSLARAEESAVASKRVEAKDFVGKWEGKWDHMWPVEFEISLNSNGVLVAVCRHKEDPNGGWHVQERRTLLVDNVLRVGQQMSLRLDENAPDCVLATGAFSTVTRKSRLRRVTADRPADDKPEPHK